MGNRARLTAAIAGLFAVVALGGCTSGDPGADPPGPTSAAPSLMPSPSASPSPSTPAVPQPERPAEMDRTDEVGAGAAASYFLSLYSYVMQSGELAEWDAMSTDACDFCVGIRADVKEIFAAGSHYSGGEISITQLRVGLHDDGLDAYPVEVSIDQQSSRQTSSDGELLEESTGRTGDVRVEVINRSQGWGVLAVIGDGK